MTPYLQPAISLITALVLAGSLYFARETFLLNKAHQETQLALENKYREAGIKPLLMWSLAESDFGIKLENVGLGPAFITRFAMKAGSECKELVKSNEADQARIVDLMISTLKANFQEVARPAITNASAIDSYDMHFGIPRPEMGIPSGKVIRIFALDEVSAKAIRGQVRNSGGDLALEKMHHSFRKKIFALGVSVGFCSATDSNCDTAEIVPAPHC